MEQFGCPDRQVEMGEHGQAKTFGWATSRVEQVVDAKQTLWIEQVDRRYGFGCRWTHGVWQTNAEPQVEQQTWFIAFLQIRY